MTLTWLIIVLLLSALIITAAEPLSARTPEPGTSPCTVFGFRGVLRALSDALKRHTANDIPKVLKLQAAHYFGSLSKAITALEKD